MKDDHEGLPGDSEILRVSKIEHPVIGCLHPVRSSFDLEASVVGDEETELEPVPVLCLQKQLQPRMQRVGPDSLLVDGFPIVMPIPAEREKAYAVVRRQVDLAFHDRQGIIPPAPDRLTLRKLLDHLARQVGRCCGRPRLLGIASVGVAARPAVEIVRPNGRLGCGFDLLPLRQRTQREGLEMNRRHRADYEADGDLSIS